MTSLFRIDDQVVDGSGDVLGQRHVDEVADPVVVQVAPQGTHAHGHAGSGGLGAYLSEQSDLRAGCVTHLAARKNRRFRVPLLCQQWITGQ